MKMSQEQCSCLFPELDLPPVRSRSTIILDSDDHWGEQEHHESMICFPGTAMDVQHGSVFVQKFSPPSFSMYSPPLPSPHAWVTMATMPAALASRRA